MPGQVAENVDLMRFLVRQHREGFCSEGETIDENPEWPGFDDLCEEVSILDFHMVSVILRKYLW